MPKLLKPSFWDNLGLEPKNYLVLTLHRPANVDEEHQLAGLLNAIASDVQGLPVIFPVHPRTAKTLSSIERLPNNIHFIEHFGAGIAVENEVEFAAAAKTIQEHYLHYSQGMKKLKRSYIEHDHEKRLKGWLEFQSSFRRINNTSNAL